jgi:hypothetical protein
MSIGSLPSCDLCLDAAGVDELHGEITEEAFVAKRGDCAIGDVPLEAGERWLLTPGDEVQVGSVVLVVEPDAPSELEHPRVRVVGGQDLGRSLDLLRADHEYVIGRNAKAGLALSDREVSRDHLKIAWRGGRVFIFDAASTRGSWLGRAAVYQGSLIEWSRARLLKVGATVLSLELPSGARRSLSPRGLGSRASSFRPFKRVRKAWKAGANVVGTRAGLFLLGAVALALLAALVAAFVWLE